ncbi:MAG TPA: hypothetical protein VMU36_00850 [Spirochaetia bacterium]|nr:hypothetical protein [Spirochaetia bacterium]
MTRAWSLAVFFAGLAGLPLGAQSFSFNRGDASLDVTLNSLNVQARAAIGPYTADLSASFAVEQPRIRAWMTVESLQPGRPQCCGISGSGPRRAMR